MTVLGKGASARKDLLDLAAYVGLARGKAKEIVEKVGEIVGESM